MDEANEIIKDLLNEQSALLWEVSSPDLAASKHPQSFHSTVENAHARVAYSIA
jgi:hypothetical protein